MALEIPLRKRKLGQKSISLMGPHICNEFGIDLKILDTTSLRTRNNKNLVLKKLE